MDAQTAEVWRTAITALAALGGALIGFGGALVAESIRGRRARREARTDAYAAFLADLHLITAALRNGTMARLQEVTAEMYRDLARISIVGSVRMTKVALDSVIEVSPDESGSAAEGAAAEAITKFMAAARIDVGEPIRSDKRRGH